MLMTIWVKTQQCTKSCEPGNHSCVHGPPERLLGQDGEVCSLGSLNREGSGPGDVSHSEVSEGSLAENVEDCSARKMSS